VTNTSTGSPSDSGSQDVTFQTEASNLASISSPVALGGLGVFGLIRAGGQRVGNLIVPPVCLACHVPLVDHDALCAGCWGQIDFIRPPLCDRLGIPLPFDGGDIMVSAAAVADPPQYDRARAVGAFGGTLQKLIHGFKYSDRHDGRRLFGRWLASAGGDLLADCDVIIPVPLNRWRLLQRRFNQSAILANEVSRRTGVRFAPLALTRVKQTKSQVGLTILERQQNVANAFIVPPRWKAAIVGRRVLLIDDVITTGSTCNAAARALRAAGAARVDVLALALVTHSVA
jgi:ComF family protein